MDTKKMYLSVLLIFTAVVCAFGQNPKRNVVFTLGENEIIKYEEYHLEFKNDKNLFTGFMLDTVTKNETFVFNGKRIQTVENSPIIVHYWYPEQEKGFVITYTEAGKEYINIGGNIYGGYLEIIDVLYDKHNHNFAFTYRAIENKDTVYCLNLNGEIKSTFEYVKILYEDVADNWVYEYMLDGYWYDNKSGKIKMSDKTGLEHIYRLGKILSFKGEVLEILDYAKDIHFNTSPNEQYYVYSYKDANNKIHFKSNGYSTGSFEKYGFDRFPNASIDNNGNIFYYGYKDKHSVRVFGNDTIQQGIYGKDNYLYYYKNGESYILKGYVNGQYFSENFKVSTVQNASGYLDKLSLEVNLNDDGTYWYRYKANDKYNIKINGDYYRNIGYVSPQFVNGRYIFDYRNENMHYLNINGKQITKYKIGNYTLNDKGDCIYFYQNQGENFWRVCINETDIYQTTEMGYIIGRLFLSENKNYAFAYKTNDGYHININGQNTVIQYDYISDLQITNKGEYAYHYSNHGKESRYNTNINGKLYEGFYFARLYYDEPVGFWFSYEKDKTENRKSTTMVIINGISYDKVMALKTDKTSYIFWYEKDGKHYLKTNDYQSKGDSRMIKQGYYYEFGATLYLENSNYAYCYYDETDDNSYYYAKINGKIYNKANNVKFYKNNSSFEYYVQYTENGVDYTIINGKKFLNRKYDFQNGLISVDLQESRWDSDFFEEKIQSSNGEHTFVSKLDNEYVVIDGQKVGKSPAFKAWYDEAKNSFIWNTIEGKELIVYEYKLD